MNNHVHVECEHQIKFCKKCDVVWCSECSKEWTYGATVTSSWTAPMNNKQLVWAVAANSHDHPDAQPGP